MSMFSIPQPTKMMPKVILAAARIVLLSSIPSLEFFCQDGGLGVTGAWPSQAKVTGILAPKGILQPFALSKEAGVGKTSEPLTESGDPCGVIPKSVPHWMPKLGLCVLVPNGI